MTWLSRGDYLAEDHLLLENPSLLESPAILIRRIILYLLNIPAHIVLSFPHPSKSALETT